MSRPTMEDELSIRLRGEGIMPGLVRSKEIAEILEAMEEMAAAVVRQVVEMAPHSGRSRP